MLGLPENIIVALIFLVTGYAMGRGVKGETLMEVLIQWLRPGASSSDGKPPTGT